RSSDADRPEEGSAEAFGARNFRMRVFADGGDGVLYEVWDTLGMPFEAPGFPRSEMLVELIDRDRRKLSLRDSKFRTNSERSTKLRKAEILKSPTEIWRCRLYCVGVRKNDGARRFVEVWDSLAEPCEYRHELPDGELVMSVADFSKYRIRRLID